MSLGHSARALCAAVVAAAALVCAPAAMADDVLLLNSYHQGLPWTDALTSAVVHELRPAAEVYIENMDAKRFGPDRERLDFRDHLARKYTSRPLDLLIVADDAAFDFALEHAATLLPGVPIVFCGVNDFDPESLAGRDNITGVREDLDAATTMETALSLRPAPTEILVIVDPTPTGRALTDDMRRQLEPFAERYPIRYSQGLSFEALLAELEALPPEAMVIKGVFYPDDRGGFLEPALITGRMAEASDAPIFGLAFSDLGHGIVGGALDSGRAQGLAAANLARRVLDGVPPRDIPVLPSPQPVLGFDYEQLKRFGIDEELLPAGALIVNRPPSLWRDYGGYVLAVLGAIIILLLVNILRRRRAEKALRESEEQYRQFFENAVEGIFRTTPEGAFIAANPTLLANLGVESVEELERYKDIGHELYADPAAREEIKELLWRDGRIENYEVRFNHPEGKLVWGSLNARVVRDEEGRPRFIEGMVADVTSRKESEEATMLARQAAIEADRMKSDLLASISHELKTPLTSILGFARMNEKKLAKRLGPYLEDVADPELSKTLEQLKRNMEVIAAESERLGLLIANVVDLNELTAGLMRLECEPLRVAQLIRDAVASMESRARLKRIQVDWQAEDEDYVHGDPEKLGKALINLVANAVKFTEVGHVSIRAQRAGDRVRILIRDSGPGIPETKRSHIFDLFSQLGNVLTEKPQGLGMGLAISSRIVEMHRGRLWVEEGPRGVGSVFVMELPVKPPNC